MNKIIGSMLIAVSISFAGCAGCKKTLSLR